MKKNFALATLLALTLVGVANASAIKVWGAEVLKYVDLNANFAHLHNSMVGGHGARLVDGDVNPSAGIAHSKLATPALLPKVWATVGIVSPGPATVACAATPCTVTAQSGGVSVAWGSAGVYTVTYTARSNTVYGFIVVSNSTNLHCVADSFTTTTAVIGCRATSTNALTNAAFTFVLFDNDN